MADIQSHRTYSAQYSGLLSSLWITLGVGGACILGFEILTRIPRRRGAQGPRFRHGKRTWLRGLFSSRGNWRRGRRGKRDYGKALLLWGRRSVDVEALELQPRRGVVPRLQVAREKGVDESPAGRAEKVKAQLGSQESWEFAYLYQPRCYNATQPAEPLPKWPLLWIWKTLSFPESKMPNRVGLDCTSHIRFLRGCVFYVVLHMCTTMVVLLPLHLEYAPDNLARSSMLRAGLSVTGSDAERKWLWVHVVLLYWLCLTWVLTLIWITWGVLMYRKRSVAEQKIQLQQLAREVSSRVRPRPVREKSESGLRQVVTRDELVDSKPGVIVEEMEEVMLDESGEQMVDESGEHGRMVDVKPGVVNLTRSDLVDSTQEPTSASTSDPAVDHDQHAAASQNLGLDAPGYKRYRTILVTNIPPSLRSEADLQQYFTENLSKSKPSNEWKEIVPDFIKRQLDRTQELVASPRESFQGSRQGSLMNGLTGLAGAFALRGLAFYGETDESIVEEVVLVRKLGELGALRQRRAEVVARLEAAHVRLAKRVMKDMMSHHKSLIERTDEVDTEKRDPEQILRMADRLKLYKTIKPFLPSQDCETAADGSKETSPFATIWEALLSMPPSVLDPYQPLTSKLGATKTANAPLIDYLAFKLRIITAKIEELKAKPIQEFTPASSAFVTFKSARLARRALKELSSHPLYAMGCRTQPAPDYSDLIWSRLNRSVFRADQVRGWVIAIALFFVTLLWIFPVSALCGLASITTISNVIPQLADYLTRHPSASSFFEDVVPIVLVAGLTIAVCPLLLLVANKAETLICRYQVHNSVLWRNWVFLEINVVIFFSVGRTVILSYISTRISASSVLNTVASSFPSAAPYYASYLLLQTVLQSFFELFRLGLPILFYVFSTCRAITPRKRAQRLAHSTISWFFSIPNSLLALGIVNLFTIYNALVLPFAFVYYSFAFLNYKRSILWVYGRRYENNGRRNCVRYIRYSLDCLLITQFSLLAFMILVKKKELAALSGVMLPLTVFTKLAGTRLVKFRFDRLRQIEADQIDEARQGKARVVSQVTKAPEMLWFRIVAWPWRCLDRYFTLPATTLISAPSPQIQSYQPVLPPTSALEIPDAVTGHPYTPYWDDIPSRDKMQSYKRQPWYYDGIQKWLWLPRDPLSTLDLEDTVEVSLCLVTSQATTDLRRLVPAAVDTITEKITVKPPHELPRLQSDQSRIGTAVDDEDDLEDDPQTNLVGRASRRLVRLLSHRREPEEGSGTIKVKRRFTRINSHRYRATSTRRRRSVNIVSNEATMAAAAKEELEEADKRRAMEAKQTEAEMRAQNRDATHPLPWYSAPFRVQG